MQKDTTVKRTYLPGDKWVYIKLYTGHQTADKILCHTIHTVTKELLKKGIISKWFFIRYQDPDFHLRIRFLLTPKESLTELLHILHTRLDKLYQQKMIWKVQLDTYNRELERYGEHLIEEAESLFHIDSECMVSTLRLLTKIKNDHYRWMVGLQMIDTLLTAFSLDLEAKHQLMDAVSQSFKREFGFHDHNAKSFNTHYREHRKTIEAVLKGNFPDAAFLQLQSPLKKRNKKLKPVIREIHRKLPNQTNKHPNDLVCSYIHMTLNRLFRSKNRKHELILYDFMRRHYQSEIARKKYN